VHLELRDGNLWAIGHVRDEVSPTVAVRVGDERVEVETDLYWSASRWASGDHGDQDVLLHSVALTSSPASLSARPVSFYPGDVHSRSTWPLQHPEKELLTRAAEASLRHRSGSPLLVHGLEPVDPFTYGYEGGEIVHGVGGPPGPMRHGGVTRGSVLRVR
jgi:hypothetical protein